ncbi:hypothetical protein J5X84_01680 [Streptosporangiaceae bacterium NEAU-GS5]|nr:hypothetical protein [Streptosporangiaceae bacterium NEAU-GS5]
MKRFRVPWDGEMSRWRLMGGLLVAAALSVAIGAGAVGASSSANSAHAKKAGATSVDLGITPADGGRYLVQVGTQAQVAAQARVCVELYGDRPAPDAYLFGACDTAGFAGGHSITFTLPAAVLSGQHQIYAKVSLLDSLDGPAAITSNVVAGSY